MSGAAVATGLVVRGARMPGGGAPVDLFVAGGRIERIAPAGSLAASDAGPGAELDADGCTVVPGLVDHHVHLSQWAMVARRIDLAGAASAAETVAIVGRAVAGGAAEVVGFGYRDGLWPDAPSLAELDRVSGERPVVLVSADLHAVWLNSAALRRFGVAGVAEEGIVREDAAFDVQRSLDDVPDALLDAWVGDAARAAAARGVTRVVDLEMRWNRDDWQRRVASGVDVLRVGFGVYTRDLERAIAEGLRTGEPVPGTEGLVEVGPYKVITDGSLNTRTAWCFDPYPGLEHDPHPAGFPTVPFDELVPLMRRAADAGLTPAVHAIGDRANARVLDAFEAVGCAGSVEHAQLLRREDVARFARLGVVASVQPEHAMDDRDVADRYWTGRTDRAFLLAGLAEAGVRLALGSDAPVAPLDPWVAMSAAVGRSRDGREPWHPEQAIDARVALAASTGGGIAVAEGDVADLALVGLDPLSASAEQLRTMPVAATILGGRVTFAA